MSDPVSRLNAALEGRYAIERELGEGGMATVYLADDLKHERKVALKVLKPELAAVVGAERFLAEIKTTANLQHPHILALFDSGEADGFVFYVMPYVEGESLRERLDREKQLPVDEAVRIATAVAHALDHAHRHKVIHRDIKPENILLQDGQPVVADFGIALAVDVVGGHRLTETGLSLGTPHYMSPEQVTGGDVLDGRSDVYALACVLYEMLAGEPPYTGPNAQAIFAKRLTDPVPSVRRLRASVPTGVDAAIVKGLAHLPVDRFVSAEEFGTQLSVFPGYELDLPQARNIPRSLRWGALALGLGIVAFGLRLLVAPSLPAEATRIAFLPWAVRGSDPELEFLEEGMVDALSTTLDGVATIRTVDPHALLSYVRQRCADVDPECGSRISREYGAGRFVLGSVVPGGAGRLQFTATLYSQDGVNRGRMLTTTATDDWTTAVDSIARLILAAEVDDTGSELIGFAALTSASIPALRAYLEGERATRSLDFEVAMPAYERAIVADSTFALAYYRRAELAEWASQFELSREYTRRALRYADRLPERARRLLHAFELWLNGDAMGAASAYRAIVAAYPENFLAWYWLAETQMHWNHLQGRSITEARGDFERANDNDPFHAFPLFHLHEIALRDHRTLDADSLTEYFLRVTADPQFSRFVERSNVAASGDQEAVRSLVAGFNALPDRELIAVAMGATAAVREPMRGVPLLEALIENDRQSTIVRARGRVALAYLDIAQGHWAAAMRRLDAVEPFRFGWALEHRGYLASLPWMALDSLTLTRLRDELEGWDGDVPTTGPFQDAFLDYILEPDAGIHRAVRAYLMGLLSARLQDAAGVAQAADEAAALQLGERAGSFSSDAARVLRAHAALLIGDSLDALREIEGTEMRVTFPLMNSSFHGRARDRYLRAELLFASGRLEEARSWYATVTEASVYDLVFLAPAALRLGEIAERLGDSEQASEYYRRVVELWPDPDSELRHILDQAVARISAL